MRKRQLAVVAAFIVSTASLSPWLRTPTPQRRRHSMWTITPPAPIRGQVSKQSPAALSRPPVDVTVPGHTVRRAVRSWQPSVGRAMPPSMADGLAEQWRFSDGRLHLSCTPAGGAALMLANRSKPVAGDVPSERTLSARSAAIVATPGRSGRGELGGSPADCSALPLRRRRLNRYLTLAEDGSQRRVRSDT